MHKSFFSLLFLSCFCSVKNINIDIANFNSSVSPFFNKVIGSFAVTPLGTDELMMYQFNDNGKYFFINKTWECIIKQAQGRWALNDSLLYILQDETKYFDCSGIKFKAKPLNSSIKENEVLVIKIIQVTENFIQVTGLKKNKPSLFLERSKTTLDHLFAKESVQ